MIPGYNILVGQDWPGLSMKPMADESWEDAQRIFSQSFKAAMNAGFYPRKSIIKVLTENAVKLAFNGSVSLQVKVQQQGDAHTSHLEARSAMRMFAGCAAVSSLHCRLILNANHCRNGSWHVMLLPTMSFGKQMDAEK
jgi:hypothetical protein